MRICLFLKVNARNSIRFFLVLPITANLNSFSECPTSISCNECGSFIASSASNGLTSWLPQRCNTFPASHSNCLFFFGIFVHLKYVHFNTLLVTCQLTRRELKCTYLRCTNMPKKKRQFEWD